MSDVLDRQFGTWRFGGSAMRPHRWGWRKLALGLLPPLALAFTLACSADTTQPAASAETAVSLREDRGDPNPRVVPPHERYLGLTYGEWQAKFFQWAWSIPASNNPTIPGNEDKIATGQPKHLWFLATISFGTGPVEQHFTVPEGTGLYVTVYDVEWDNILCIDPDEHHTVPELRDIAKSLVDQARDIRVELDGSRIENVTRYRSTSPVFYSRVAEDDLFGCTDEPAGIYGPMVSDGYVLILPPLPVGEHLITERYKLVDGGTVTPVNTTWHITVKGEEHDR
jgi:hypothetical protein